MSFNYIVSWKDLLFPFSIPSLVIAFGLFPVWVMENTLAGRTSISEREYWLYLLLRIIIMLGSMVLMALATWWVFYEDKANDERIG